MGGLQAAAEAEARAAAAAMVMEPLDAHLWAPPPPALSRTPALRALLMAEVAAAQHPDGYVCVWGKRARCYTAGWADAYTLLSCTGDLGV